MEISTYKRKENGICDLKQFPTPPLRSPAGVWKQTKRMCDHTRA